MRRPTIAGPCLRFQSASAAASPNSEAFSVRLFKNREPVKDFSLKTLDGRTLTSADLRGKVTVINFWATWCPPCKAEIPGFVELQQAYGEKGLQIVGVSVDDTPDKLKPFAAEFKMNYPVLVGLDRDDLQDAYGPMWGIPTTFVISRDGRICRKNSGLVGKAKYETDIKGLL